MDLLLALHNAVRDLALATGNDTRPSEAVIRAMVVRVVDRHPELADFATERIGYEGDAEARRELIDHATRLAESEEKDTSASAGLYSRSKHHAIQVQSLAADLISAPPKDDGWLYQARLKKFAVHAAFALVADNAPPPDVFEALGDVTLTLYGGPVAVPPRQEQPSP